MVLAVGDQCFMQVEFNDGDEEDYSEADIRAMLTVPEQVGYDPSQMHRTDPVYAYRRLRNQ